MIRSTFPDLGKVHSLSGAAIKAAYGAGTASPDLHTSGVRRVRFFVHVVTDAASALTSVTMKLKARYVSSDGQMTLGYRDIPSTLDDVQGAAQPKGSTFEVEHAFTVSAGGTFDFGFYLDNAGALPALAVDVKANAAGAGNDLVEVYAQAA